MKNIDFVIKKTALELNIPEDQVKVVVMEYWKTIYNKILTGSETAITVRHIGTFTVSRWKLYNYIKKIIAKIKRIRKTDKLTDEKKKEILDLEYKRLRNCLYHRNKIAIDYAIQFGNI